MSRKPLGIGNQRVLDRHDAYEQKHLDATLEASRMAIKGLMAVNSAGMVAMIGLTSGLDKPLRSDAGFSVFLLAIGASIALIVFMVNYFGQLAEYLTSKGNKPVIHADVVYRVEIVLWIASAGCFIWAVLNIALPMAFPGAILGQ